MVHWEELSFSNASDSVEIALSVDGASDAVSDITRIAAFNPGLPIMYCGPKSHCGEACLL